MDDNYLRELVEAVKLRDGGVVLSVGDKPEAVVLTIEKYNQLVTNAPLFASVGSEGVPEEQLQSRWVLVTGGAGYIGAHTVRLLQQEGWQVVVLDNLSTGRREFVPETAVFIEGDISNQGLVADICGQYPLQGVLHFAASLEVAESLQKPFEYLHNNALGTAALIDALNKAGVKNIVLSSTAAIYGAQLEVPIKESALPSPSSPYGYSKFLAEHILEYATRYSGFHGTVLRYFNVVGAEHTWGLFDTHSASHVVPTIMEVARGAREHFTINGSDYNTFDGTCVRDYIHVLDIAQAHILALETTLKRPGFAVYNVGTGRGVSVQQLVQTAAEITGHMIPIVLGPRRLGDDEITLADTQKITKELGFKTQHSELETMLMSSWQSFQERVVH